jgi:UDP-N-acetyl-alpha-D-muramoyl-L-alanyl-L-glutamate epimerase
MERFEPEAISAFHFVGQEVTWDVEQVTATFRYRLVDWAGADAVRCTERYVFPLPMNGVPVARRAAFETLLLHLGLVAGLSYYKLAAPAHVVVEAGEWTAEDIDAHRTILAKGLGEYCWVNGIDPELWPEYAFRSCATPTASAFDVVLPLGPLVPVGGGKDSCVSIEAMRRAGFAPTLITVNRYPVIQDVIAATALPDISVERHLDPQLRWLNDNGARNGHVPATAIVSLAVACTAVLHGHHAVVMSNERSASEGNVTYRGVEINHQWSKSADAEDILRMLMQGVVPSLGYFSLLRPRSELSIARSFAETCSRYFGSFSSCNGAFRLDPDRRVSRWCGKCPKCQFVYLALATVLGPMELQKIWGSDVLADSPIDGFRALLGLTEWKPFECVGESVECRVALSLLSERVDWSTHPVVRGLSSEVSERGLIATPGDRAEVFAIAEHDRIPPNFRGLFGSGT